MIGRFIMKEPFYILIFRVTLFRKFILSHLCDVVQSALLSNTHVGLLYGLCVVRSVSSLTSCARLSSGSRICHPRRSTGLGPGSSLRMPRRTRHTCAAPAGSRPPLTPRTAVAENNNENKIRTSGTDDDILLTPNYSTVIVPAFSKLVQTSTWELFLFNNNKRASRGHADLVTVLCAVSGLWFCVVTLTRHRGF